MTEELMNLQSVSFGYPGRVVLTDVTFSITQGEIVALLGPNGAGKSTLLKGMLGLLPVLSGELRFSAKENSAAHPGYVPQQDSLDPVFPLTAAEVVLMGTFQRGSKFGPVSRRERLLAYRCLVQVGLKEVAKERFATLSGGQKQRVLIARALAANPSVLMLDEPTAGVDPGAEQTISALLQELNRERNLSVILVSHHISFIRAFVHSAVWVENGSAIKGPAAEMLSAKRIEALFGVV